MATIGIYEKALPKNISWLERFKIAKKLGFDFVEMSIDETDKRLQRLDWTPEERNEVVDAMKETGISILSICLSGHRRYPFGSSDPKKREKALTIMNKAIDLASDLNIKVIQLAGYDVYYEEKTQASKTYFTENLRKSVETAEAKDIILLIEIMDDPFMSSISKYMEIKKQIPSPYLEVYPDLGNLSAWPENDVNYELELGISDISAIHLKDTLKVTDDFPGKFKEVPFGEGGVDFLSCLQTLKRLKYDGPFLIEMWSETSSEPEQEIEKAKAFLIPILKEAGYNV